MRTLLCTAYAAAEPCAESRYIFRGKKESASHDAQSAIISPVGADVAPDVTLISSCRMWGHKNVLERFTRAHFRSHLQVKWRKQRKKRLKEKGKKLFHPSKTPIANGARRRGILPSNFPHQQLFNLCPNIANTGAFAFNLHPVTSTGPVTENQTQTHSRTTP